MKNIKKIVIIILALLVLLFGGAFAAFKHYTSKLNRVEIAPVPVSTAAVENSSEKAPTTEKPVQTKAPEKETGVTNILVIGVDNDYAPSMDQLGNADGLIIASINHDTKQIVLTSLMRDIRAYLPSGGYTKLTLAYHQGGTPLLVETIEQNFEIDIDNYVLVNYIDVVKIVDAVGGVPVDLTSQEIYYMEGKIKNVNSLVGEPYTANVISEDQAGRFTLNGVQAAAYMRVRMAGNNDFERTERAREVIFGIKDKLLDMNMKELDAFADTVLPCITTDLSQKDILKLLMGAMSYLKYDMVSFRMPIDGAYEHSTEGSSYIIPDYDVNRAALHRAIYEGGIE